MIVTVATAKFVELRVIELVRFGVLLFTGLVELLDLGSRKRLVVDP